jgi:predicted MFS family arabinose efflux permease
MQICESRRGYGNFGINYRQNTFATLQKSKKIYSLNYLGDIQMNSLHEKFRKNIAFIIITVLVLLAAFICSFAERIGENPFAAEYYQNNPVQSVFSESGNAYVTDSSTTILYTDSKNRLEYVIYGADFDNTFDVVDSVATLNGDIYVIDSTYDDSGTYACVQRLLKFTDNGKKREVLYTTDTVDEDGKQIIYLDSPVAVGGEMYFTEIATDGIYIKNAAGDVFGFMPLENAYDIVADSTFDENFGLYAVLMNGDVYAYSDGESSLIYNARDYDTEEYRSLVSEIVCGEDGVLYLNDIGLRRIYTLDENGVKTFVDRNEFTDSESENLADNAIYTGLVFSEGNVSAVSASYEYYDEESDYSYETAVKNQSGDIVYYGDTVGISTSYRAILIGVYLAIILAIAIALYSVVRIVKIVRMAKFENSYTQLIVLVTAIAVTIGVSYAIFNSCNERFMTVSADNLANVAYLADSSIDKDIFAKIDSPDDYFSEDYARLSDEIGDILESHVNDDNNIYAVLYKVYDDVICEVYRRDGMHAVMYPMAGTFEGSIEQGISQSGECFISGDVELADGSYTFVLIPSYDENGELLGLIEVGMDYNYIVSENSTLYKKILIISAMAVIIIMLFFGEIMNAVNAVKGKRKAAKQKKQYPPEVIRPVVFVIFFTANITTAFLPIYGMSLWNDKFPAAAEVAAAFPLSAEYIMAALSALLCGLFIKKLPVKAMCVFGGCFYIFGNVLSAFAPDLWVLITANSLCGIGGGVFSVSINTFIAGYDEEEKRNKGFIHYNAAVLAGMNCGTVVGSLICDNAGVFAAYMTAAAGAVLTLFLSVFLFDNRRLAAEETDEKTSPLKTFVTGNIVRYFICIMIPYFICGAFLSYYFPVVAENNSLSAVEISMAFLISGVISIYTGSVIGEIIINHIGAKKSMVLAAFIYAAALFYLYVNPSILSCYVVIVLFAAADSFGFSALSAYFISCPEVIKYGQGRSLGIQSTIGSVASACGSVVFGAALLLGEKKGILCIALAFTALIILFVLGGIKGEKIDNSQSGEYTSAEKNLV